MVFERRSRLGGGWGSMPRRRSADKRGTAVEGDDRESVAGQTRVNPTARFGLLSSTAAHGRGVLTHAQPRERQYVSR